MMTSVVVITNSYNEYLPDILHYINDIDNIFYGTNIIKLYDKTKKELNNTLHAINITGRNIVIYYGVMGTRIHKIIMIIIITYCRIYFCVNITCNHKYLWKIILYQYYL